jgi:hypothetical protein
VRVGYRSPQGFPRGVTQGVPQPEVVPQGMTRGVPPPPRPSSPAPGGSL